jgi:hypothetical protein
MECRKHAVSCVLFQHQDATQSLQWFVVRQIRGEGQGGFHKQCEIVVGL